MDTVADKKLYEGLFLVDSGQAAGDWDGTLGAIETVLKRADAQVVAMRKWSERRLAYDVDHKSRGTYILCYFKADGSRIAGIEKDVQLSDRIMRVLILSTEGRPAELLEQDITGKTAERQEAGDREAGKAPAPGPQAQEAQAKTEGEPPAAEQDVAAETDAAPDVEGQAPAADAQEPSQRI